MTRLAQANNRDGLIAMAVIFGATNIGMATLRVYARRLQRLSVGADDWFALLGTFLVLALNVIFIAGTAKDVITGHSPVENNWPVSTQTEHDAERYKYAFQSTEKIAFGLLKISVILLWNRIFGQVRSFRICCWVMIGIVTAWSLAFFFGTIFQCGTNWWLNWAPIGMFLTQCSNTLNMLSAFAATDILTDFIIMFMPIPMIWSLQLPVRKKLAITAMFTVGLFVVGAGIARLYVYLVTSYDKQDNPDFIADFTLFILWSDIEANVAVVSATLPTLLPVINKSADLCRSLGGSQLSRSLFSSLKSRSSGSKGYGDMSYHEKMGSSGGSISNAPPTLNPLESRFETHVASGTPARDSVYDAAGSEHIVVEQNIHQYEK